jgi:hypothetical protein
MSIKCHLRGGLGNQMFMYAFNFAIAKRLKKKLLCDDVSGFSSDYYRRLPGIKNLNVQYEAWTAPITLELLRMASKLPLKRLLSQLFRPRILIEPGDSWQHFGGFCDTVTKGCGDLVTFGYWQNEKYFLDYRSDLKIHFSVRVALSPKTLEIAERIKASKSLSIHFRRKHGLPAGQSAVQSKILPLSDSYYLSAVKSILKRQGNLNLFCFGDDPVWMTTFAKQFPGAIVVSHNDSEEKSFEDLYLMNLCENHIISNSTFSWWGAWLSENPAGVVVSPSVGSVFGVAAPSSSWEVIG